MADPGFPVGGRQPLRGGIDSEVVTFRKFYMSKRKNLDPWGGGGAAPGMPSRSANARGYTHTTHTELFFILNCPLQCKNGKNSYTSVRTKTVGLLME